MRVPLLTDAPPPPVPADTDLRHMPGYMIDVQSLLGSDLAALGDPAANWFAVLTWCASFHQIPAGSLPDDDTVLAYLVRLGRDVRTWKRMREKGAMRGWVKHSDGRLYHPVVTETVLKLLGKSKAGKTAAEAKQARRNSQAVENVSSGTNDRSTNEGSSLQQSDNNRKERKGIEGKGREGEALGHSAEPPAQGSLIPAAVKPGKRPRQTRIPIPPDWSAVGEDWQYAIERGFTPQTIPIEEDKFRLHFLKSGEKRPGWSNSWKSWILKALEIKAERAARAQGSAPGPRPSRADTAAMGMLSDLTEEDFGGRPR